MDCNFDCTNGYCCPPIIPGFLAQPHHLPGYLGHVPTYRNRFGGTYGKLSRDVLEDPCAVASPVPILVPPDSSCKSNNNNNNRNMECQEDRFAINGSLAPRCCETDIYRCCEPMCESYAGHVPGFFPCSWGRGHGRSTYGTKIFLNNAGFYNSKFCFRGDKSC